MNANGSASYAQLRAGVQPKATFESFEQEAGHRGPTSAGEGIQTGNIQSTSFIFPTKQLSPNKPQAYSADTSTSLLGARQSMSRAPGMGAD